MCKVVKIKSKIAFLLILTQIFSTIAFLPLCFADSANTKDVENYSDSRFSETLLIELGIVDSGVDLNSIADITRSQFAIYMAKVLGLESDRSTYFTDVDSGSVINLLGKLGYVLGDNGKYRPDELISFEDALKYMLLSLGYEPYFKQTGYSYAECIRMAKRAGLVDNVYAGECINGTQLISLLNNMLFADRMLPDGYNSVNNKYYIDTEKPLIKEVFNADIIIDIVTANEYVSLYTNVEPTNKSQIRIGDKIFDSDIVGIDKYIGSVVRAYYFESDRNNKARVFAIFESDQNNTVTFLSDKIADIDRNKIEYYNDNDKKCRISISDAYVIHNGEAMTDKTTDEICDKIKQNNTLVKIYKPTSYSGDRTIIVADTYLYGTVHNVDTKNGIVRVEFDGNVKTYDTDSIDFFAVYDANNESQSISYTLLRVDTLVCCAVSSNSKVVKLYSCAKSINGTVEKVEKNGDKTLITVDDTQYEMSEQCTDESGSLLGRKATFFIDMFGKIAMIKNISDTELVYAYIYNRGTNNSIDVAYMYKFIDQNGKHIIGTLAKKVNIDGVRKSAEEVDNILAPSGTVTRQLVRLRLNAENEIKQIDTALSNADGDDTLTLIGARDNRIYRSCPNTGVRNFLKDGNNTSATDAFPVSTGVIEFTVPPLSDTDLSEKNFGVKNGVSFLSGDDRDTRWYWVTLYSIKSNSDFVDAIVYEKDPIWSYKANDTCYLVNEVYCTLNDERGSTDALQVINTNLLGSTANLIMGSTVNIVVEGLFEDDGRVISVPGDKVKDYISPGDVIQIGSSSNSEVYNIRLLMDYSDDSPKVSWGFSGGNYSYKYENISTEAIKGISDADRKIRCVYGYVDDMYLTSRTSTTKTEVPDRSVLWISDLSTGEVEDVFTLDTQNQFWAMYDSQARGVRATFEHLDNIKTVKNVSNSATKVFIRFSNDGVTPMCLVFYK